MTGHSLNEITNMSIKKYGLQSLSYRKLQKIKILIYAQ